MKIINIGQHYWIKGGSDRYMVSLEQLLKCKGHEVITLASRDARNLRNEWQSYFPKGANFEHPRIGDIFRFVYSFSARRAVKIILGKKSIDIAHLHIYYGKLTSSIINPFKKKGVPIVQTLHEYRFVCPTSNLYRDHRICTVCKRNKYWPALWNRCNRKSVVRSFLSVTESYVSTMLGSVRNIDQFISVSEFQRKVLIEKGLPANRVRTIYNFVTTDEVEFCDPIGDYCIFLGRVEENKGVFTLLEAASELRGIKMVIAGDGGALKRVKQIVEKKQLNVFVLGRKTGLELDKLIRESLCVVMPSEWYETFGLSLVEGFARGRPVVASRIGGIPEVVEDGNDGFLVEPGDPKILAEAINRLFADKHAAKEMGRRGRRKAETLFSPHEHYKKLVTVYRALIG